MPFLKILYDDSVFPPIQPIDIPDEDFLACCYKHLDCSCIETAPTVLRGIVLVVDESGKCKEGWESKVNPIATVLYGSPVDCIVGNAILCRVSDYDLVPLTDEDCRIIDRHFPFLAYN
jgi:hypothetical protein